MCACVDMAWQVYAFDPTRPYTTELDSNVTFRCWGLPGGESSANKGYDPKDHTHMGAVLGPLASLEAIMEALGHTDRHVQVLKIDCASHSRCMHGVRLFHFCLKERGG